jgi:hypothetical protein
MSDPDAIRSAVLNDGAMDNLIHGRIYPLVLPPTTKNAETGAVLSPILPAVTYGLVSQPVLVTQDSAQYRSPRWRFKIWSDRYADLVPIATALAAIFGDQAATPFPSSRIEYPASRAEDHETATNRYWRAVDVVVGLAPAVTQ